MASALRDDIIDRLQTADLPSEVADLVERALCGDTLDEAPRRYPKRFPRPAPSRAWINRIGVTGFRGVGPTQALDLQPGPGLTIIVGRNGSGKSSFAEALEVALAGSVRRLHHMKTREFRSGWRNAHHGPPSVSVTLSVPGRGGVVVRRTWEDDAEIDAGAADGLDDLGWQDAIRTWRPFLGYDELAGLVAEGPAHVFDAVFPLLGLDELRAGLEHLAGRRRQFAERRKIVKLLLDGFRSRVAASPDARAQALAELLAARKLDLDAIDRLLDAGEDVPAAVVTPESAVVAALAHGLDEVADRLSLVHEPDPGLAIELLAAALRWQQADADCPVCGTGRLDEAWRARTQCVLAEHRAIAAARSRRRELTDWARRLVGPKPQDPSLEPAWNRWSDQPSSPAALARHLRTEFPVWEAAVLAWRAARVEAEAGWGPLVA
nr:AAA family ATPase [Deltaproteobacteria bacterium]